MSELKKRIEQKKAADKRVEEQVSKDTEHLAKQIDSLAEASEQERGAIVDLIETAIYLTETTGQSIYQLLKIDEPVSVLATKNKSNSEWLEYKRTNNGKQAQYPGSEPFKIRLKGGNNAGAEAAFHAGTLELL